MPETLKKLSDLFGAPTSEAGEVDMGKLAKEMQAYKMDPQSYIGATPTAEQDKLIDAFLSEEVIGGADNS